eukprot:Em0003g1715a
MLMQVSQVALTDAGRIDGNSSNRLRLQSFWSGLRSSNEGDQHWPHLLHEVLVEFRLWRGLSHTGVL